MLNLYELPASLQHAYMISTSAVSASCITQCSQLSIVVARHCIELPCMTAHAQHHCTLDVNPLLNAQRNTAMVA